MTATCRFRRRVPAIAAVVATALALGACGDGSSSEQGAKPEGETVRVTIGYQSKTINTVTAGTLLRDLGILERRLTALGKENGNRYEVVWEDYPSGPPITAQMLAGKVDIGSMGDYPFLVNGSKTKDQPDARSELISITGYNLKGSLNGIVVPMASPAKSLKDLKGKNVSVTFGSAGHGMVLKALSDIGAGPDYLALVNQQPEVGAAALEGNQVAALAQFVPWPEVMVFRDKGRKLFDGGTNDVPTMHGVVVRQAYAGAHPEVVETFLASQLEATRYLQDKPVDAAERVAKGTGLEPEVVYLFNGPNGLVTFDPTIKDRLVEALEGDLPFLKSLGALTDFDLGTFINPEYLKKVYGGGYEADRAGFANRSALEGRDEVCEADVSDPATASEAWFQGQSTTKVAVTPTCLLRLVKKEQSAGSVLRAAYVPDAGTATRTFAHRATWVQDPAGGEKVRLLPFAIATGAEQYVSGHPGSSVVSFQAALAAA